MELVSRDQKVVDAAVKEGVRRIPGGIVEEVTALVTRV